MREIIFRGKRCDNGEWVYGDLCHYSHGLGCFIQPPIELSTLGIEVKTETVGQYTGLKDKNGTKIFEGDILLSPNMKKCECIFGTYKPWSTKDSDDFECWMLKVDETTVGLGRHTTEYLEVIGNIYDNPELLEEYE